MASSSRDTCTDLDERKKRNRKLLFCEHCQQFLPKSTFYNHERFRVQKRNEGDSNIFHRGSTDIFEISSDEECLRENEVTEVFELSGDEPDEECTVVVGDGGMHHDDFADDPDATLDVSLSASYDQEMEVIILYLKV